MSDKPIANEMGSTAGPPKPLLNIASKTGSTSLGNPNLGHSDKTPRRGINDHLENAFANDIDPQYELLREKPIHRYMIEMYSEGETIAEVAARFEMTPGHVSNVLRQPWARQYMIKKSERVAEKDWAKRLDEILPILIEGEIQDAINENLPAKERRASRQYLIDRKLGKNPTMGTATVADMSDAQLKAAILAGYTENGKEDPTLDANDPPKPSE